MLRRIGFFILILFDAKLKGTKCQKKTVAGKINDNKKQNMSHPEFSTPPV
jgi:hypothetical protein